MVINRQRPVLWPFGMTPKRFIWRGVVKYDAVNGPSIRPSRLSFSRYSLMTCGCRCANAMFAGVGLSD